jgi:hypothetical protein
MEIQLRSRAFSEKHGMLDFFSKTTKKKTAAKKPGRLPLSFPVHMNSFQYRLDRISMVVEEFLKCGDFKEGLARIKCTNPECGHDYFVPLSCKGFYLCPSCHQKKTLLFGEQMVHDVLLRLPHRQFVFTLPKALRVFFKHDRLLFSDISNLIFDMVQSYYDEASSRSIETGMILSYQTSGDFARWNPHFHALLIEGGFDDEGKFFYLPISSTGRMTELFRRIVIKHFQDKKLINDEFARNLLSWKNSGFSIDNSVRIFSSDDKAKESLAQYIARCPISLEKITYEPFHGKVLFKTTRFNDYFKENFKAFDVLDFIAELTAHIPPKNKIYIRRYGLYSSRTRGIWKRFDHIIRLAPSGWKEKHNQKTAAEDTLPDIKECSPDEKKRKSAWAMLIKKVYGTDPLVCPKCGSEMQILAVIFNPEEIKKILTYLVKIGRSPPCFNSDNLN